MDQGLIRREHTELLLDNVFDLLESINDRFIEVQEELREIQPRMAGSTILYLNSHSLKQSTCFSCPHPIWRKTGLVGPRGNKRLSLKSIKGNPVKSVTRRGPYLDIFQDVADLISEVQTLYKEKKKYSAILGNLSRALSYRIHIPELGERLTVRERGSLVKSNLLERLTDIDAALMRWAEHIEALQPGEFNLKVVLELGKCNHGCDFCPHPEWYIYKETKGGRTRLKKQKSSMPLKQMTRSYIHVEQLEEVRESIKKAKTLMAEREKYQDIIRSLAWLYQSRNELVELP
jgi:hypothetical protein